MSAAAGEPLAGGRARGALRRLGLVALVVAAAFGYARLAQHGGARPPVGGAAPALRLPLLGGGEQTLAAERGRPVVLNFWASWCAPCVAEMPSLERLSRALGPEGVSVLTVSIDEDEEALRAFVLRHRLTLPVLRDPGGRAAASAYGVGGYPETFVVDPQGRIARHVAGPVEWDSPEWQARLRGLRAVKRPR